MRTSVLVGLVAGSALSVCAYAQDEHVLTPIMLDKNMVIKPVTPNYVVAGPPVTVRDARVHQPGVIFDRITTLDSYFWFGYLNGSQFANDVSLSPGDQSALYKPSGQLITGMDMIFTDQDNLGTGRSFDIVVTFWDQGDPGAGAGIQAYSVPVGAGGFISSIAGLPAGWWIISWNLTGLPGGGIQCTDDGFHLQVSFLETGGTAPAGYTNVSGLGTCTVAYNSCLSYKTSGNQNAATNLNGYSDPWFFWDNNQDGVNATNERYRAGGDPGYLMPPTMTIRLYGDTRCPADFTNDGFVDPLDFTGFINAYVLGDPCP